jgi:hypothetical protein
VALSLEVRVTRGEAIKLPDGALVAVYNKGGTDQVRYGMVLSTSRIKTVILWEDDKVGVLTEDWMFLNLIRAANERADHNP